jgi:16S rRNA (adenine1518-N6/adenine1519-N6)-dimethyltransferase
MVVFDQHYLVDSLVLDTISLTLDSFKSSSSILEIGPGKGVLTQLLLKKGFVVTCIEIDKKNYDFLCNTFSQEISKGQLQVVLGSFQELKDRFVCEYCVSNIPYSITESFYHYILDMKCKEVVVLQGMHFFKEMNSLDSLWSFYTLPYSHSLLMEVSGKSFSPPTKVSSALVHLQLKKEVSTFEAFIDEFHLRRKQKCFNALLYALVSVLKKPKKTLRSELLSLGLDSSLDYVERISSHEIVRILTLIREHYFIEN